MDDAYIGGEQSGGKRGRGSENKTPFIAAVSTTEDGKPDQIKLNVVKGFRKQSIGKWARAHLEEQSQIITGGLACFSAVTVAGCEHEAVVVGKGNKSTSLPCFNWVNTSWEISKLPWLELITPSLKNISQDTWRNSSIGITADMTSRPWSQGCCALVYSPLP